jgi:hypothetical protein
MKRLTFVGAFGGDVRDEVFDHLSMRLLQRPRLRRVSDVPVARASDEHRGDQHSCDGRFTFTHCRLVADMQNPIISGMGLR